MRWESRGATWRGDGRLFAAPGSDQGIYVWDLVHDRLQSVLEGHQNSVFRLQFTPAGDLLLTSSWDGTVRVWDPVRGNQVVTAAADVMGIDPEGRQMVVRERGSSSGSGSSPTAVSAARCTMA